MRPEPAPTPPLPDPKNVPVSLSPSRTGALGRLARQLAALAPGPTRGLVRRLRAEARAAAIATVPLPLYEVWKLGSIDPFVTRATTLSHRTSSWHFLILAGVPMTDSGGGQRPAQLAHELLHGGHRVTYVYRFPSREYRRRRRSLAHENLTHIHFAEFSARRFSLERETRERIVAICEIPFAEYRACTRYLGARGARTIYDCAEDWEGALDGKWYARSVEDRLLAEVDFVLASSRGLKESLGLRTGRDVALVPNAVDTRLFVAGRDYERPADLPRGEAVFTYVGALWGDGFDWESVFALARARPAAQVVLVGDHRGQLRTWLPNLHCLGLRPRADIPAYLAHSDVCLIPWRRERLGRTAAPLKAFEYLAMGKPVVSLDLPEVRSLPGVLVARDARDLVAQVARAQGTKPPAEEIARFLAGNGWKARVRQLERLIGA